MGRRMPRWIPWAAMLALAFAGGVSADRMLGGREAREAIAALTGAKYPTNLIHIRSVSPGIVPTEAIVEAQLDATFHFTKVNGRWVPKEVRIGDQQWESLDELKQALDQSRRTRTDAALRELAEGLERYRAKRGGYVVAGDIVGLTDALMPEFVTRLVRRDGWNRELQYQGTAERFRLASLGPDGKPNTTDDIIVASTR